MAHKSEVTWNQVESAIQRLAESLAATEFFAEQLSTLYNAWIETANAEIGGDPTDEQYAARAEVLESRFADGRAFQSAVSNQFIRFMTGLSATTRDRTTDLENWLLF